MRELLLQLQNIWRYYRVPRRIYSRNEVFNAIGSLFQWNPRFRYELLDQQYAITTGDSWYATMRNFWLQQKRHVANLYDCDDFAFWMKAWAAGLGITGVAIVIDYSAEHAYNVIVLEEVEGLMAYLIEPQTGFSVSPRRGLYQMQEGV